MLRRRFHAMGTDCELFLKARPRPEALRAMADAQWEVRRLESIFSRFDADSELSELNRRGTLRVGPELLDVVDIALAARDRTGGRFDPTVHDALVAAGYDRTFEEVSAEERGDNHRPSPALRCAGSVRVDRRTRSIELDPGVHLDLGGIAKGYAVDRAAQILGEVGPCLVDAGGDIAARGRGWPIGLDTGDGTLTLELGDGAVATSGRDRRHWTRGSEELHHIIDPATGLPSCGGPSPRHRRRGDRDGRRGSSEGPLPRRSRGGRTRGERHRDPRLARHARRPHALRGRARMKTDPTFWILARSSGLLAYALLTSSVLAGLVLKSRPFGTALKAATVADLHRFLAMLGLGAVLAHASALVLDSTVHIGIGSLLVPGLAPYRPLWTGLGVLAAELMVVVYASFSLRKRIGARNWRRLHWATYLIFALATVHGLTSGTDSSQPWALGLYGGAVGAVVAATAWRALVPPTKGESRVPHRDRPVAV